MIEIDGQRYERLTVEAKRRDPEAEPEFAVYGWGTYPKNSVLADQPRKVWLDAFPSVEAALRQYPQAMLSNRLLEPKVNLNHLPGPDDPVPGGMYPDDWPNDQP